MTGGRGADEMGVGASFGAVEIGVGTGTGVAALSGIGTVLRLRNGDGVGVPGAGVGAAAGVAARFGRSGTVVEGGGTSGTEPVGGLVEVRASVTGGVIPADGTEPVGGLETSVARVPSAGMSAVRAGATGAGVAGVGGI
jgi:hypothetical protein